MLGLKTADEVQRFLRDLCTLPELEALTHRWQTVQLLEQGVPVRRDRRARARRAPPPSPASPSGSATAPAATGSPSTGRSGGASERHSLHPGRRQRPADARRALEGAHGRAGAPALRRRGALASRRPTAPLVVPCANAPVDLLLVRPSDIPEYVQDGVVDLGITGANLVVEADADVVTLAELGFARCTPPGGRARTTPRRGRIASSSGLRVATAYPVSTRALLDGARDRGRARHRLRLGRGGAAPRALAMRSSTSSRPARPRARTGCGLIGTLLESQAVLVGSEAALAEQGELVERLELMLSGVVAAPPPPLPDDERARLETLPAIRAVLPSMGAPSVLTLAERGADRRPRRCRRRRRLEPAPRAARPRAPRRSSSCRSSGSCRERRRARRRAAARRRDRRRRPRARRRGAARLDGAVRRRAARRLRVPQPRRSTSARVDDDVARGSCARSLGAVADVQRGAAARRHRRSRPSPGIVSERRWLPLASVGIYVPGGRARYPSSLVMAAVPALVAGVERIAVVTPRPAEATLAVARELGLDEVYAVGGAQAVAALAYGTETIAPVDKIVGPGNAYVTAAKLLVSSRVGDRPSGRAERGRRDRRRDRRRRARAPPTCSRRPSTAPDSEAILLALDPALSRGRRDARRRHENVPSSASPSLDEALARSEAFAPEHLELLVEDADARRAARPQRRHASSSARPPSSATTRRARRTSCRPAGSRAAPAGSASRRS